MMNRGLSIVAVTVTFALVYSSADAYAGALNSLQADGQTINWLEDNDFETLIKHPDNSGATVVQEGDVLVSIFEIQGVRNAVTNDLLAEFTKETFTFTGVSIIQVKTVTVTGPVASYVFEAADSSVWTGLGLAAPMSAGTVALVYDDPASAPANHIDPVGVGPAPGIATATNGTLLWEIGFNGDAGEFWTATTFASSGSPDDFTNIESLNFKAGLNVTYSSPAVGDVVLLKHNYLSTQVGGSAFTAPTQVQLVGNLEGSVPSGSGYPIATGADFYILPFPEPSSMILLGIGLAGIGGARLRRRKTELVV